MLLEIFCLAAIYYPTEFIQVNRTAHLHDSFFIHVIILSNVLGVRKLANLLRVAPKGNAL